MNKRISFLISISLALAGLIVFSGQVESDTNKIFNSISGIDNTEGALRSFTATELNKLAVSDNSRIQTDGNWPMAGAYDENKYLEFIFTPNLSAEDIISSVSVTSEYYRSSALAGAKLEIWDGSQWHDVPLSLPHTSGTAGEISETKDITSFISSPVLVNGLKMRFLAYRNDVIKSGIKTSHDLVQLSVNYSVPILSPTLSDSIAPTPTPLDLVTQTPTLTPIQSNVSVTSSISFSNTPTPISEVLVTSTPSPTPILTRTPTVELVATPTPVSVAIAPIPEVFYTYLPTMQPTFSGTPTPSNVLLEPTPATSPTATTSFTSTPAPDNILPQSSLLAVIAPPKKIKKIETSIPKISPIVTSQNIKVPAIKLIGQKVLIFLQRINLYFSTIRTP